MRNLFVIILVMWLATLLSGCTKPEVADINDIDTKILQEMEDKLIPSVVACIVTDTSIVWEGTYGFADRQSNIAASRETTYSLQSISKLILATTVMQLWEQGRIDLQADISNYLPFEVRNPYYPDNAITPFMLLHHSSGIARPEDEDRLVDFHHFYSSEEEPPMLRDWIPQYILPGGSHYRNTVWKDFAPGTMWLYSNIATSLLALIVEEITGMDYRDYCQIYIFEPLEMHNTSLRLNLMNQDLQATPYYDNNRPFYPFTSRHYPVGWVFTNIEDFSHFVIAIMNEGRYHNKQILQPETVDKMLNSQTPGNGVSFLWWTYYGNRVGHDGGGTGYRTWAEWEIAKKKAIFIFSNKQNNDIVEGGRIYELIRLKSTQY